MKASNGKIQKSHWVLPVCILIAVAIGVLVLHIWENRTPRPESGGEPETAAQMHQEHPPKEGLTTILFMGLDKYQTPQDAMGYLNDQQADFLMLVVMDEKTGVCDLLHLNRDTMTEIRRLGVGGGEAGKFTGQLALSHTFGSGGSDSCLNTVKAVSKFLKGVKIDHYVAMTLEGVAVLNDLVGGVTVEVLDHMTDFDPYLVKGETVRLHGQQALIYVRTRSGLEDSSNLHRMERQRQYLNNLYVQLMKCMNEDQGFLNESLLELTSYFQSDCSVNQLDALGQKLRECQVRPITVIDGEAVKGEEFIEFYADEQSLDDVLITLFCES